MYRVDAVPVKTRRGQWIPGSWRGFPVDAGNPAFGLVISPVSKLRPLVLEATGSITVDLVSRIHFLLWNLSLWVGSVFSTFSSSSSFSTFCLLYWFFCTGSLYVSQAGFCLLDSGIMSRIAGGTTVTALHVLHVVFYSDCQTMHFTFVPIEHKHICLLKISPTLCY